MADSLPTYNEVTTPGKNQATEFPEKVPYPTEAEQEPGRYPQHPNAPPLEAPYFAQGQYPQAQQPYPVAQQPYPPTQQPYQQPYNPTQQYPGEYPQGYVPQPPGTQGYPPTQPVYQPPQSTNVTVTTAQQGRRVQFSGGSNSFIGIIVLGVISLLCCFPFGLCALILAILAYREYVNDNNSQEAVRHSRIAMALGIAGIVLAIVFIFITPVVAVIAAITTATATVAASVT